MNVLLLLSVYVKNELLIKYVKLLHDFLFVLLRFVIFLLTQFFRRLQDLPANMGEMCFPIKFVLLTKIQPSLLQSPHFLSLLLFISHTNILSI
jgi:hypothetical protein